MHCTEIALAPAVSLSRDTQAEPEQTDASARAIIIDSVVATAQAEGQAMTLQGTMACALGEDGHKLL